MYAFVGTKEKKECVICGEPTNKLYYSIDMRKHYVQLPHICGLEHLKEYERSRWKEYRSK